MGPLPLRFVSHPFITAMAKEKTYMLSHRDEQTQESERLQRQYDLLKHVFSGQLLHPSIPPLGEHFAAADIGTGTGAWLNDLARAFPRPAVSRIRLVGFDISSSKYPSVNEEGVDLVVHDITKRFPTEYHGIFDVVHLRLLVYAIREEDIARVVENATELLRQFGRFIRSSHPFTQSMLYTFLDSSCPNFL